MHSSNAESTRQLVAAFLIFLGTSLAPSHSTLVKPPVPAPARSPLQHGGISQPKLPAPSIAIVRSPESGLKALSEAGRAANVLPPPLLERPPVLGSSAVISDLKKELGLSSWGQSIRLPEVSARFAAGQSNLSQSLEIQQLLVQGNAASSGMFKLIHITRVDDPARSALYYVQSEGAIPKFVDNISDLRSDLEGLGAFTLAQSVYVFVDGPSRANDARALQISIANDKRAIQIPIIVAGESLHSFVAGGSVSRSVNHLTEIVRLPVAVERVGPVGTFETGWHHQDVLLKEGGVNTFGMSIAASSRRLLERFLAVLSRFFLQAGSGNESWLALVQKCRVQMAADLGMTLAQIDKEISINIGESQVADCCDRGGHASSHTALVGPSYREQ